MASNKNVMMYALGGEGELSRREPYGFFGVHGYTYDVDEKGKKKLSKDVPTTTGYFVGKGSGTVVIPIDVLSLIVSGRKDFLAAMLDGFITLFKTFDEDEEIKNIGVISKYHYLEKLFTIDPEAIKVKDGKFGKLVFEAHHYPALVEAQTLYAKLLTRSKFWFNTDQSVEGGLGMKSADEQSSLAEVISVWGIQPETTLTFTPQKEFWNPETDFNKIVCGTRWYFNTINGDQFFDDFGGYRRYDFGKLDKKKYYGKITPDVTYSCLFTKTPIELLDKLYRFTSKRCPNPKGLMFAGDLQFVKSKPVGRLIDSYPGTVRGKDVIIPFNVSGTDNPTLIELIDPPGLSYRISEIFDDLSLIFKAFLNKDENNRYGKIQSFVNITDQIYTPEVNGKGVKKLKINPAFKQSTLTMTVQGHHSKAVKPVPLHLGVSFDLPTRNAFNSATDPETQVWINIEESDDKCLRYRTVVVSDDWVYIQTTAEANVRVLNLAELGK